MNFTPKEIELLKKLSNNYLSNIPGTGELSDKEDKILWDIIKKINDQ